MLSGCVSTAFVDAKIDPSSPVAADVAKMSRGEGRFPTFADIPRPPKDLRPVAQYGEDANAVLAAGEALVQATAPGTWTLDGTDTFADRAREAAGPQIAPPNPGDAEAFARELRERAKPPPPR
ncbi:MAG: hypothetical protein U1C74_17465 [Phenylobacterium sp.]|nr:hypothetical protein [Phenylobacterium sp.]